VDGGLSYVEFGHVRFGAAFGVEETYCIILKLQKTVERRLMIKTIPIKGSLIFSISNDHYLNNSENVY